MEGWHEATPRSFLRRSLTTYLEIQDKWLKTIVSPIVTGKVPPLIQSVGSPLTVNSIGPPVS